jgi:hypothetical protein
MLREDGTLCSAIDARNASNSGQQLNQLVGSGVIEITYDPLQLATGQYSVLVQITDLSDALIVASGQTARFDVYAEKSVSTPGVYMPCTRWIHHTDA